MTTTFQDIMAEFKKQTDLMKWSIRSYASTMLVQEGSTEVGTSDVNSKIVQLYKELGSFSNILIQALNGSFDDEKWTIRL